MFYAEKNNGAYFNNHRIRVSKKNNLDECLFATNISGAVQSDLNTRVTGCAALDLAYVAAGKIDGFWERDLNLWDICSGVLLVKEAGGKISEPNGDKWTTKSRDITVSNSLIHNKLLENLTLL